MLAAGAKFDDTSPTLRGVFVRNRLLCQTDPAAAARTSPSTSRRRRPAAAARSTATRRTAPGNCAGCHNQTDPIGFGLENYDRTGAYRAADKDDPSARSPATASRSGLGTFNGPAELGER